MLVSSGMIEVCGRRDARSGTRRGAAARQLARVLAMLTCLVSGGLPVTASAEPGQCTTEEEASVAACREGACVWHYTYYTDDGKHTSWCYESRADAEHAAASMKRLTERVNAYFRESSRYDTGDVYCSACGSARTSPADCLSNAVYGEWRRQYSRLKDPLPSQLPWSAGDGGAAWALRYVSDVNRLDARIGELQAQLGCSARTASADAAAGLDRLQDDIDDAGAVAAGTFFAAKAGWPPPSWAGSAQMYGLWSMDWGPPRGTRGLAPPSLRFVARKGRDGRVHIVWQNTGDVPLSFTLVGAAGGAEVVSCPAHGAVAQVVDGAGRPLLPMLDAAYRWGSQWALEVEDRTTR